MPRSDAVTEVFQTLLSTLKTHEGEYWKEVQGELQLANEECPFWVLLFEDSDLAQSHSIFAKTIRPVMQQVEPLQFTVAYKILKDDFDITLDTFMDNDEILDADGSADIGSIPDITKRGPLTPFYSQNSGSRP